MRSNEFPLLIATAILCAVAARAAGGEGVLEVTQVEVKEKGAGEDAQEEAAPAATPAWHEEVDELRKQAPSMTTGEVLESTPSLRVKKYGSAGSPSIISLRGMDAGHTLVLLDKVPLNDAMGGMVDLSTIPAFALDDVTVYRGALAAAGTLSLPAGVVKLGVKKPAPGLHVESGGALGFYPFAAGGGTGEDARLAPKGASSLLRFGALRQALLSASWFDGTLGVMASGSFESGEGDFPAYMDNGTVYNLSDDRYVLRRNNGSSSVGALLSALWLPDPFSELRCTFLEFDRRGGSPGLDVVPAENTELGTGRQHLVLSYARYGADGGGAPLLDAGVYFSSTSLQWLDPLGEISNVHADSRGRSLGAGASLAGTLLLGASSTLLWGVGAGYERWKGKTLFAAGDGTAFGASRVTTGAHLAELVSLLGGKLRLDGSLRVDCIGDALPGGAGGEERGARLYLSPGAGVRFDPFGWLSLSAGFSWSHRPPSLIELFGNRGTVVGNPALAPERGLTADVGAVAALPLLPPGVKVTLEYRFFTSRVAGLISFIQNSQRTMVAQNIGEATIDGMEIALRAHVPYLDVAFGYTFLDPRDSSGIAPYDGKMLPGRPRHDAFLDVRLAFLGVALSYGLDWLAGGFVDRASLRAIAPRAIHSLGVVWTPPKAKGFWAGLALSNVGDAIVAERKVSLGQAGFTVREAITDVDGYPLPGLAVTFSAGWRM